MLQLGQRYKHVGIKNGLNSVGWKAEVQRTGRGRCKQNIWGHIGTRRMEGKGTQDGL